MIKISQVYRQNLKLAVISKLPVLVEDSHIIDDRVFDQGREYKNCKKKLE